MEMRVWPKDGYGGVASGSNGFQVQQSPDFWRELGKEGSGGRGSLLFLYGHNNEIDTLSNKIGNYFFLVSFFLKGNY